jgi:hypothetical protein
VKPKGRSDPPTERPTSDDADKLSLALDLLKKILKHGTNQDRRYCLYCKVSMRAPIELHKEDCVWRQAWKLVNERKE